MARKRETAPVDEPSAPPASAMTIESIPLGELHEDPANARRHPERNLATIRASLARFGQVTPIVIDANNVVRKGNGTLMAARQLGWAALKATRTTLSGVDAAAYGVVDNRSSEQAEWDETILATTLEAIRSEPDFPLEATGFDEGEVAALLEKIAGEHAGAIDGGGGPVAGRIEGEAVDDPMGEWSGMPECENEDQQAFRSIHVHFRNADDLADFFRLIGQIVPEKANYIWHPRQEIVAWSENPYVGHES